MLTGSLPGFEYEVDTRDGSDCSSCGRSGVALLWRLGDPAAFRTCEVCAHLAYLAWRQVEGEVPPGFPDEDTRQVSTVAVLVARRKSGAVVGCDDSYEFAHEIQVDGTSHPPTAAVARGKTPAEAAVEALGLVGLSSWPCLMETLYTTYTPRGRLMAVVLARGWSPGFCSAGFPLDEDTVEWLPWPVHEHAGRMAGAYLALQTVWPLRLYKHVESGAGQEICVRLREVARRHVDLLVARSEGRVTGDDSMLAAYASAMTADEVAISDLVRKAAQEAAAAAEGEQEAAPPEDDGEDGGVVGGDGGVLEAPGDEGDSPGGIDSPGDASGGEGPRPGFARRSVGR